MQGFNMGRYMPPASQDPSLASDKVGGFNSQKGHPLGSRFSKAKDGIIKIRFEMPFDVWCETCKPEFLIKQGIRFNAEKKKTGKYLSTPVWEFSFRHPPCSGTIAIRTDPENTAYVVSAGGRKKAGAFTTALDKDYGEIITEEERERRRTDAFARLEGQTEEKQQGKVDSTQIKELYAAQSRNWDDPYAANRKLRRDFRVGRKQREASAKEKEDVTERYGLGFELLDHRQEDADRAALIEFGDQNLAENTLESSLAKPLFSRPSIQVSKERPEGMTKSDWKKQKATKSFQQNVVLSTKAKLNPFATSADWSLPRKKMKTLPHADDTETRMGSKRAASEDTFVEPAKIAKLVSYDDSGDDAPD
jgi:coiled-coil domain-containing protein 130